MKSLSKILLAAFSLIISNTIIAQGKSGGHANANSTTHASHNGVTVRESARVNGSINANAHANENGKNHANENSVLNGDGTARVKVKKHSNEMNDDNDEMKDGQKIKLTKAQKRQAKIDRKNNRVKKEDNDNDDK